MVVCKCRKATKLYCFVHKVPVCGDCICFPEHRICVVSTYSEWVIDGDYDWPPKCCCCQAVLTERTDHQTIRLGCLHAAHTNCFVSHVKSFAVHTAPDGYICPACSTPIWPPKSFKDSGSLLHSKLKESIMQIGLEKNLFGNHPISLHVAEPRSPLAFASQPLIQLHAGNNENSISRPDSLDIVEIDGPSPTSSSSSNPAGPGATTRKSTMQVERNNSESIYYANDEDAKRKYSKRGTMRYKFLRSLLPFWSGALPTLPVTAPPQKDTYRGDDVTDGHARRPKTSRIDPRKILLVMAIMACMATMGILYYRIAQRDLGEELPDNDQP